MSTKLKAGTATSGAVIDADTSGILELQSGSTPTTAITVDASQNVGIGTSTPTVYGSYKTLEVRGTGGGLVQIGTGASSAAYLFQDGTNAGFQNIANGVMTFGTNNTERMRIDSSGNFLVGSTTSSDVSGTGTKVLQGGIPKMVQVGASNANNNYPYMAYSTTASKFVFYVDYAGSIYAVNTSIVSLSDQTLKTNIKPLETGLSEILKLQPRRFDWLDGSSKNVVGFVAQEVKEILPDLTPDFQYNETETKLGLKMGDMIPTLVKAIQELNAKVTALEAQLGAK